MSSPIATPWAVICPNHGRVFLTDAEYNAQMNLPDAQWICLLECGPPDVGLCGEVSEWDDGNYERWYPDEQDEAEGAR